MLTHSLTSVLMVARGEQYLGPFVAYLRSMPHVDLNVQPRMPRELSSYHVVVTADTGDFTEDGDQVVQFVHKGGGWLGLVGAGPKPLPEIFGAQLGPAGPECELRIRFDDARHPLAVRLPETIYVAGCFQPLAIVDDRTSLILYTDWLYSHVPVLVERRAGAGVAACTTLQAYDHPIVQQILYRLLRRLAGRLPINQTLAVGILGYPPSVGQAHAMGVTTTPGLRLHAACDLNPDRLSRAGQDFPELKTYSSAEQLADDPAVDVVIVATPPNTHASLCLQMMAAGKHVVCEKPLVLTLAETNALLAMAEKHKVHLSCHQNRRWDVDYLSIKMALNEGLIGDLFYLETFVGGFQHPCGYWHSHAAISGGTAYDWGGHYLDWLVSLIPEKVVAVVGTRQKRVWHDITNADQERIHIRFAGGQEAEFMHSDIAAVRKPKWYLLGTRGAIVGHWREVSTYEIDPVVYFHRQEIPPTEMPPDLTLYSRHHSGQLTTQHLAVPKRQHFPFHRNLADHLLTGEPIVAPVEDSVRVVAILEAAARSADKNGSVEVLDV
jgi:predicted dehydrogenase